MTVKIDIHKKDYSLCEDAAKDYWANKKKGRFGKGLIATSGDPTKPVRIGLLGEFAVAQYLGCKFNFEYKKYGEEKDLVLPNGKTIEVKTASRNYGAALIRCCNSRGRYILKPSKMADYYIACFLSYIKADFRSKSTEKIPPCEAHIMGWLTKDEVLKLPMVSSRLSHCAHKNYELNFEKIHPIEEFKLHAGV